MAGCGRGDTAARPGTVGCRALGVDIQPAQIDRARRRRYGSRSAARFAVADATGLTWRAADIPLPDVPYDRVHCPEAAFHFGHEGRRSFLNESFRLLSPGGLLVLVDVTSRTAQPIGTLDPSGLVRGTWRFDDIEPYERYPLMASAAGFTTHRFLDWTTPVLHRAALFAGTAATRAGRQALCVRWPGLRNSTPASGTRSSRSSGLTRPPGAARATRRTSSRARGSSRPSRGGQAAHPRPGLSPHHLCWLAFGGPARVRRRLQGEAMAKGTLTTGGGYFFVSPPGDA